MLPSLQRSPKIYPLKIYGEAHQRKHQKTGEKRSHKRERKLHSSHSKTGK